MSSESASGNAYSQPWIKSPLADGVFILAPALLAAAGALWLAKLSGGSAISGGSLNGGGSARGPDSAIPLAAWLALVVGVDVAHVYATLFRWPAEDASGRRRLTALAGYSALFCWVAGAILYSVSAALFWTAIAYFAAYHFVRQQYGFAMIYMRREPRLQAPTERESAFLRSPWPRRLDKAAIYAATLYPLIYWHCHMPRAFSWFIDGDFIPIAACAWLSPLAGAVYALLLFAYFAKEGWQWRRAGALNLPKNIWLAGTAASWYVAVVALNGDLEFTLANVVAHGVPYIALAWLQGRAARAKVLAERAASGASYRPERLLCAFRLSLIPVCLGALVALAYAEEGLWDGLVWRERASAFPLFDRLPAVGSHAWLALLVPLLALPQATHYLMDGLIWRARGPYSAWSRAIFFRDPRDAGAKAAP
jgi:hypothetical protein